MTPRIILTHDPAAVSIDAGPEALCVRHPAYQAPRTAAGCLHVDWQEFEAEPRRWMDGRSLVVVVGLNRIITPGNRTREVFEVLYNLSRDVRKLSIDQTLFVAEPWRAWFHFGFVGAPYREYTYSYLAESHWRAHQDGVRSVLHRGGKTAPLFLIALSPRDVPPVSSKRPTPTTLTSPWRP